MLREAARSALVGGAPDTAAALLRRALDEPPDATDRPLVLFELGNAEHEIGDMAALGHLREAGETATDPLTRARAFIALAWTTHPDARRQREQLPFYERAAAEVGPHDRELALQLEAARLGALLLNPDLPVKFEDEAERFRDLPALTAAECLLRSFVARQALDGRPDCRCRRSGRTGRGAPRVGKPGWTPVVAHEYHHLPGRGRALRGRRAHPSRAIAPRRAQRLAPVVSTSIVATWSRPAPMRRPTRSRGGCASRARYPGAGLRLPKTPGVVVLIDSLADQGRVEEGEAVLAERGMDGELMPTLFSILPVLARGRLRVVAGDYVRARPISRMRCAGYQLSRGLFPWANDARVALVPVLRALGDDDSARAVADEALATATAAAVAAQDRWSATGQWLGRGW